MNKKGFTLMELIVVMGILAVVMVVIGGMAGFTAGRLKSNQLKVVNDSLRSTLDLIGQKMNNANEKATIDSTDVYGFYADGSELMIVSVGYDSSDKFCTFFKQEGDALWMDQKNCSSVTSLTPPVNTSTWSQVTPDKIKVTDFSVTDIKMMENTGYKDIPKIKVTLSGYNTTDKANAAAIPGAPATLETTFTMDGENIKYLNNN